ncbi:MAG: hypothetical protein J6T94_08870 [Bacteroidaceae bacterium]|nr:hypothetical protein [Bacteroidaceae bacterium]
MKKISLLFTTVLFFLSGMLNCSCQKEDPQKEVIATIEGTWTLTQATAAYRLGPKKDKEKTPINDRTLRSIFGSVTFTFEENGVLNVGGNDACHYEVSEDGKSLTMVLKGQNLPIDNIQLPCDILELTDKRMELGLSANEVVSIIIKYITTIDLSFLPIDATVSLIFTR